ncbi:unnamed protein product [Camellia sinensis]
MNNLLLSLTQLIYNPICVSVEDMMHLLKISGIVKDTLTCWGRKCKEARGNLNGHKCCLSKEELKVSSID